MSLLAQKHDYNWFVGDGIDNPLDNWGRSILNYSNLSSPTISYDGEGYMNFYSTDVNMSDSLGRFIFSFNGLYIENSQNDIMENSQNLGPVPWADDTYWLPQGGLVLPLPESTSKYILIHETHGNCCDPIFIYGYKLYYSIIDMNMNNGLGAVVEKKQLLVQDTLAGGKLMATKHANGRDWWMIIPRAETGEYYRFLITPNGIELLGLEDVGMTHRIGVGQAFFSQDGTKYVTFSGIYDWENYIYLNDFDRCTGLLSNPMTLAVTTTGLPGGSVVLSPNGKLLYFLASDKVFQYDLTSSDINSSKFLLAEIDSYLDTIDTGQDTFYEIPSFFFGGIAPDGRINICSWNTMKSYHTIEHPNVRGEGCQINQHSIHFPTAFTATIPNFPNYRLGPIDGSICDSLGIDNVPLSRFRYDQDTSNSMSFDFINLSNYEPAEWHWDFGDGTISQDTSPTHLYAGVGDYPVCLTVSNQYGSNTMSDTLHLGVVATQEVDIQVDMHVWPNPFADYLMVSLYDYYPKNAYIYFYDITGRFLRKERVRHGANELDLGDFPKGMIFYEVREIETLAVLGRGKMMKAIDN